MPQPTLTPDPGWMGDRSRGAGMGRPNWTAEDAKPFSKFNLRKLRLDSGGYDEGGAYWGIGEPLYWAASIDGKIEYFFRAASRYAARVHVLKLHPGARFFR